MNRNYVVCECTGTTAGQIEQAVQQGGRTFDDVKARLGVGKQCIKCKDLISLLIESSGRRIEMKRDAGSCSLDGMGAFVFVK